VRDAGCGMRDGRSLRFFSAYHDPRFASDGQERIMTANKTMMSGKIRFYEKQSERYGHFIRSGE